MKDWRGICERAGEFKSIKAYATISISFYSQLLF
jgi:hypothetical protein